MVPVLGLEQQHAGSLSDAGQNHHFQGGQQDPFGAELHGGFGGGQTGVARGQGGCKGPDHCLQIYHAQLHSKAQCFGQVRKGGGGKGGRGGKGGMGVRGGGGGGN